MKNAAPIALPTMASVADTAAATGLPESMIRNLVQSGAVKHVRSGRKIYVNMDSLAAYLAEGDEPQQPTLAQYDTHPLTKRGLQNDDPKN